MRLRHNSLFIVKLVIFYVFTIIVIPSIRLYCKEVLAQSYYSTAAYALCNALIFIILSMIIISIGNEKKRTNRMLIEIAIIDIPALWMATIVLQCYFINIYFSINIIHLNMDFITLAGGLLIGAEVYRYYELIKSNMINS